LNEVEEKPNYSATALSGLPRRFYVVFTGTLFLFAASGCTKHQPASIGSEEVAGETYEAFDERRDALNGSRGAFGGQGCTVDCSGHEAGYAWAEEKGVTDPNQCGGKSWSFIEGCRSYAEEASDDGE
jgi:hypothetical protein